MSERQPCSVLVRGDYACFSRPEFKTERVTYTVMTPSAARGILEAIFWKPEFRWEVEDIGVLKPIKTANILRNEIGSKQSPSNAPIVVEERRQQRTSIVLRDVGYIIVADLVMNPHAKDPIAKYVRQFEERVERGRFHHAPYLGTREFAASFETTSGEERVFDQSCELGPMLFDLAFIPDPKRKELAWKIGAGPERRAMPGYVQPIFFDAKLESGHLRVPHSLHDEKTRLEGR